jgi:hypothetical protein
MCIMGKDGKARLSDHNYREQPFCSPCADGKGANAPKPESSHQDGG